jgi:hypothetical protein
VNAVAAIYVAVAHANTVISHVVHRAIHRDAPDILPLRADLTGVNAVLTTHETVLHEANSAAVIIHQRVPKILLLQVVKRF